MERPIMEFKDLQPGKIYFASYGGTQLVFRYKDESVTKLNFFSHLHYWNQFENFHNEGYGVKDGLTELREATKPEKFSLVKFEIENGAI